MQQHPHRYQRAIGSLMVTVALFGLAPWLLLRSARYRFGAGNPLVDIAPPWQWDFEEIGDIVSEPLRDDAVVNLLIRSSLTVIWLALVTVATTIIVEVVHMVRHRGMASPRIRGIGWAQHIGRWIAVGIIAVLPLNSFGSTATALEQPVGPVATAQRFVEPVAASPFDVSTAPQTDWARSDGMALDTARSLGDAHRTPHFDLANDDDDVVAPLQLEQNGSHTIQRGESIYGIAADYASADVARTNELADAILDLNLGEVMNDGQRFTNAALVQPGWDLTLPAGIGTPVTTVGTAETEPAGPLADVPDAAGFDASGEDEPTPVTGIPRVDAGVPVEADSSDDDHVTHVVVPGDTLFDIAGEHLGDQDAWPEIYAEHAGDDMGGGRSFDDPDLILPGWEIDVPTSIDAAVDAPAERVADTADAELEAPSDPDDIAGDSLDDVIDSDVAAPVSVDEAGGETRDGSSADAEVTMQRAPSSVPAPAVPPTVVSSTTVPAATGVGDEAGPGQQGESAPEAPSPIRLEHAALLAAGVLTLIGVRRRRALRAALPHARVPTPSPEIAATERRLRTIDPGERAARVDIAIRAAAHHTVGAGVQVGSVRIAPDGELILRLTGDVRLDAPWVGEGRTWTLPASVPIEMVSDDARQSGQPCLALVTVGIDTEGRDVLVDLEAAGITAIEATGRQGDEVLRAIGSGIATSLSSEVVHLLVAELGVDVLFDHPNTRRIEHAADTVDAAAQIVGSTLASDRGTFDMRTRRTGGEMWEPAIVLLAHADDAARTLRELPATGHGIAAVAAVVPNSFEAADNPNMVGARIRAHADRWELVAFGESVELTPIGLSEDDVEEIVAILEDAATPVEVAPIVHVDVDEQVADPLDVLPHDIVVSLMGGISIADKRGAGGSFQRSKTVELIAWLSTHRERATRSAARTALWELDVRDATFANVVSEARRGLGRLVPLPDGEEWIGRTLNESLPLHGRIVTDADLIKQRVDHAQMAPPAHAVDVLRPAVEMIHGLPFAGSSYLWPDADGFVSNLVLLATTATSELAAHALSMGDTDLVFWATGHGLKVLPGHEELVGLRMRAHARAGDLAGVRQEWESYERVITADSWSDGEPAPKLLDLRRELLTSHAS